MNDLKSVKYFTNEVFKNVAQIEEYFTTVAKAIEFFELSKGLRVDDLEKCKKAIEENYIFNNSL